MPLFLTLNRYFIMEFNLSIAVSFPRIASNCGRSGPCIEAVVAILNGINNIFPLTSTCFPTSLISGLISVASKLSNSINKSRKAINVSLTPS